MATVRDWEALGQVAQALVEELTLERVGAVVVEQSQRVFHSSLAALWMYDQTARELRLLAQRGYSAESTAELCTLSLDATSPTARAARIGEVVEVRDMHAAGPEYAFARRIADREGLRSLLAIPLQARGHLVGALTFVPGRKAVPHRFTRRERGLTRAFADLCAAAIENARLYAEAQEAIRLRGEFISVAAHELRTPVTSLKGFAQLVIRDLDRGGIGPERLRGALETIDRQADRLTLLVGRLLDVARLESGRLALEPRRTDVRALVGGIVEAAQRDAPEHRLSVVAPGPVEAEVDALRIEQVVSNLVDNAIKYSPSGGEVVVEIEAVDRELRLAVRDQGIGIPPERRRQIFERFYQAHTERNLGGMGLGLYVSNQIVRLHGGRIEAEFPDSGGSCFVVTLPGALLHRDRG
ncbi:MAG TPA: ATP-binding protein [Chloroflexota bacterium]